MMEQFRRQDMAAHQYPHATASSGYHEGHGRHAFNPVRGYMDIASNPIAYSKVNAQCTLEHISSWLVQGGTGI